MIFTSPVILHASSFLHYFILYWIKLRNKIKYVKNIFTRNLFWEGNFNILILHAKEKKNTRLQNLRPWNYFQNLNFLNMENAKRRMPLAYASNNWLDRKISSNDSLRVYYKFWEGETNTVKDWSTIWIGCCAIVNSALLTLRLNHSRQIQRPTFLRKSPADRSSSCIGPCPERTFHVRIFYRCAIFYIFHSNERSHDPSRLK